MSGIPDSAKEFKVPLNTGQMSVAPGGLSANRILQQRKVVDRMLRERQVQLHSTEIEEKGTPASDITPVFKARKGALLRDIARLKEAQKYWARLYDRELDRLRSVGTEEEFLRKYESPNDPSTRITPEELHIPKLMAPDPAPLPDPYPTDEKQCKNADRGWIESQWNHYWAHEKSNQQLDQAEWDLWQVERHFWELRRAKTLAKGKPFTDAEPPKPEKSPRPELPACPPPN